MVFQIELGWRSRRYAGVCAATSRATSLRAVLAKLLALSGTWSLRRCRRRCRVCAPRRPVDRCTDWDRTRAVGQTKNDETRVLLGHRQSDGLARGNSMPLGQLGHDGRTLFGMSSTAVAGPPMAHQHTGRQNHCCQPLHLNTSRMPPLKGNPPQRGGLTARNRTTVVGMYAGIETGGMADSLRGRLRGPSVRARPVPPPEPTRNHWPTSAEFFADHPVTALGLAPSARATDPDSPHTAISCRRPNRVGPAPTCSGCCPRGSPCQWR